MINLKNLRKSNHLKQEQLGKIIKITPQAYGHYENDKRKLPLDAAYQLAKFFKVSLNEIYDLDLTNNSELSQQENELLKDFKQLTNTNQQIILNLIKSLKK